MTVQERASKYISPIEAVSGKEGHKETFKVAAILRNGFALSVEDALPVMMEWNGTNAIPPWTENAIQHKLLSVDSAYSSNPLGYLLSQEERAELGEAGEMPTRRPRPRWPKCDHRLVVELLRNSPVPLIDFNQMSPGNLSDLTCPYEIIDRLFCRGEIPDPYLCFGKSVFAAETRKRCEWEGLLDSKGWQYIVPNHMRGAAGKTATGKLSPRSKSNVLERRFIVIECDFVPENHPEIFEVMEELKFTVQDVCTTVLAQLRKTAQPAMAVNSGSKSIHGWFPVVGASRRAQIKFFREACLLGADPQMAHTNQWTRFPTGIRENNGAIQKVEYFDPDPFLLNF